MLSFFMTAFFHAFAEYDSNQRIDQCGRNGRTDDCGGMNTAVLPSVGDHGNGNQLKRGNIDD